MPNPSSNSGTGRFLDPGVVLRRIGVIPFPSRSGIPAGFRCCLMSVSTPHTVRHGDNVQSALLAGGAHDWLRDGIDLGLFSPDLAKAHPHWQFAAQVLVAAGLVALAIGCVLDVRRHFYARRESQRPPSATLGPVRRRLTPLQSAQIIQALNGATGELFVLFDPTAHGAVAFADDIVATFRKAGWQVTQGRLLNWVRVQPPTGIAVEMPGGGAQPIPTWNDARVRVVLRGAMESAGVTVDVRDRSEIRNANACIVIGHTLEAEQQN
jgi:hypothetical protein